MVLTDKKNKRIDSGMDSQSFQIQASSKAFEILSSGLYNNRERAVLRELMCNAYDAHVAANKKEVPFEVVLPTRLDPTLTIKDYGTGLSEENVYELYTTYFNSDKADSNMFVGALGLGSKSPFSVTDQFTVKSRYEKQESTYLCFISAEGIPQVSKVGEKETTEGNGLTIQLAIDEGYINKFKDEYFQVIRPFALKPVVKGLSEREKENVILYHDSKSITEGAGWKWMETDSYYSRSNKLSVIQGNVEYPLNSNELKIDYSLKEYFGDIMNMRQKLLIYFPLGTLNVAANREELSLDARTMKNIEKRLFIIKEEIQTSFLNKIQEIQDEFELIKYVDQIPYALAKTLKEATWKDTTVENAIMGRMIPQHFEDKIVRFRPSNRGLGVTKDDTTYRMPVYKSKFRIFYYDYDRGKNKGIQKIKNGIRKGHYKKALLIYDLAVLDLYYGEVSYTNLSEYEDPTPKERMNVNNAQYQVTVQRDFSQILYREHGFLDGLRAKYYNKDFYNMLNHSKKKALCVVSGGNKRFFINGVTISEDDTERVFNSILDHHKEYFKRNFLPGIYKVKKWEMKTEEFQTNPNIVKIDDVLNYFFKREAPKMLKPAIADRLMSTISDIPIMEYTSYSSMGSRLNFNTDKIENKNSPVFKVVELAKKIKKNHRNYTDKDYGYLNRVYSLGLMLKDVHMQKVNKVKSNIKTMYINKLNNEISEQYPMLKFSSVSSYDSRVQTFLNEMINYINMVDSQK